MKKSEKPWQTPTKKMTNNMNQWCHDWVLSPLDSIVITTLTKTFDVMMSFQNMNFANPPIIKFPHFLSPFSSPIFVSFFCSLCHKCHFRLWCQSTISCPIFFFPILSPCHVRLSAMLPEHMDDGLTWAWPSTGPPPRRPRRGRGPAPAGRPAQGPAKRPRRGWGDFEEKHLGSFNNILMTSVLGVELHLCLMILMT